MNWSKALLIPLLLGLPLLLAACAPIATLNALVPSGGHTLLADQAYGPDPRQRFDLYRPSSAPPAAGFPLVVFFYGGSWNSGERAQYKFVAASLATRGVAVLVADYRLYPDVRYPDFLRDSAMALVHALREARALGADPLRIFVMGHSAGAYNAAMLALDERWLQAHGHSPRELAGWIGLAGPYDFLPITNPAVKPVFMHPNYPPGSQPIDHAHASAPPSFLGAANTDPLVDPDRNSQQLAARLQAVGVPVQLRRYPRVNHLTLVGAMAGPLRWLAPVRDDVAAFVLGTPPAGTR